MSWQRSLPEERARADGQARRGPIGVLHPVLAEVAAAIEATQGAAALLDHEARVVWVSEEFRSLLIEGYGDEHVGYGKTIVEAMMSDAWCRYITPESQIDSFLNEFPYLIYDIPGGVGALRDHIVEHLRMHIEAGDIAPEWMEFYKANSAYTLEEMVDAFLAAMEPAEPPTVWTSSFDFVEGDLPPMRINETHVRLRDDTGKHVGTLVTFDPALPARVHTFVARGDEGMYRRMLSLIEPGLRQAAVLFADLHGSARLSRKLASAAYFRLIRDFTTESDSIVARNGGVVGKHAGDGATAFFIAEDLGGASAAARAAITTAREIRDAAARIAKEHAAETGIDPEELCRVNIGAHWGGRLFMGQLVTGGRLEVTALGDAVNECARIQESARDGRFLASKVLLEQLEEDDASHIGIDVHRAVYTTIDEIEDAPVKAKRDAGTMPVAYID